MQEGDRIAQLILEKIETPDVVEVTVSLIPSSLHYLHDAEVLISFVNYKNLEATVRGAGGFGSTGGHKSL